MQGAEPTPYRVALIDDHAIIGVALENALREKPRYAFMGVFSGVAPALRTHDGLDLVLLDLSLKDGTTPAANVALLVGAGVDVLGYTSGENAYLARLMAKTRALGIIRKSESVDVLLDALDAVSSGHPVVTVDWAAAVEADPQLAEARLSPQEQRVLSLFASGLKAQSVAFQAGISVGTVDDYIRRIRRKYLLAGREASTKVDLYMRAVEDGILPTPGAE